MWRGGQGHFWGHSQRVMPHTAPRGNAGWDARQEKELPLLVAAPGWMLVAMETLVPVTSSLSLGATRPTQRSSASGKPPGQWQRRATARRSVVAVAEQLGVPAGGSAESGTAGWGGGWRG